VILPLGGHKGRWQIAVRWLGYPLREAMYRVHYRVVIKGRKGHKGRKSARVSGTKSHLPELYIYRQASRVWVVKVVGVSRGVVKGRWHKPWVREVVG
jgi:hypothetical protein